MNKCTPRLGNNRKHSNKAKARAKARIAHASRIHNRPAKRNARRMCAKVWRHAGPLGTRKMNTIHSQMLAEWGRRCEQYDEGCVACRAWTAYDKARGAKFFGPNELQDNDARMLAHIITYMDEV